MKVAELAGHGLPEGAVKIIRDHGIEELFPPQVEAVEDGLLDLEDSFVISVPTASGKTFIAELLMVRSIMEKGGKCLYIVPLKALASEKLEEFKKYEPLGITTGVTTGDMDSSDAWLAKYDIIVTTSEKADSLLRHKSEWLGAVNCLVCDEIHLIHDGRRGPTLEVTIAKMRHLNPDIIVLGLSATIQNAGEMAGWLDAKLIQTDWRPVDLKEGIYFDGEIFFDDSSTVKLEARNKKEGIDLGLDTIKDGGQSLVFVSTRKSTEKFAEDAGKEVGKLLSGEEMETLRGMAEQALNTLAEPTTICRRLAGAIENGAAFHHAGLAPKQRKIVEEGFKSNHIKVLSATPTLAAGVNLPARRVIIRDYKRYMGRQGYLPIPVMEYKQMCGRAGRPKYDPYGEAVLIGRNQRERDFLLDEYILGEPEKVFSKLAVESTLRTHVLATIVMGYANSLKSLAQFFSNSFYAHQEGLDFLMELLEKIVNFLVDEGFCVYKNHILEPELFGRRTSELYIDPMAAVIIRDGLIRAQVVETIPFSYLHLISSIPEIQAIFLGRKDEVMCSAALYTNEANLLIDIPQQVQGSEEINTFLSYIKTALFFSDWIDGENEEFLREKYGTGPGDIRNKVDMADWLLYAASEIGRVFKLKKVGELNKLRMRVHHGIREELLPLVSLKGIGRARARRLHASGLKGIQALKDASPARIARVKLIGPKIAISIKKQLGEEVDEGDIKKLVKKKDEEQSPQKKLMDF